MGLLGYLAFFRHIDRPAWRICMQSVKRTSIVRASSVLALALGIMAGRAAPAMAQLNGLNIRGDFGLDAGTQAPPGAYYGAVFYRYGADTIKDLDGNKINTGNVSLNQFVFVPLVSVVTKQKVLGANYSFAFAPALVNLSIESPRFGQNPGPGLGDTYIQPISLGWHMKQADVVAGYALFAPTGRYTVGADDNTGLDMWGNELTFGTTAFFDEKKTMDVSTLAAVEFHGKKRHSDAQVGTLLTMEGGLGRNFAGGAAKIGFVYVAQWKLTDDTLTGLPALLVKGRNSVAALGPELTLPLAAKGLLVGFLTLRYEWEFLAHTATQGNMLVVSAAFPFKPIKIK
jgi:hypothetical protein